MTLCIDDGVLVAAEIEQDYLLGCHGVGIKGGTGANNSFFLFLTSDPTLLLTCYTTLHYA